MVLPRPPPNSLVVRTLPSFDVVEYRDVVIVDVTRFAVLVLRWSVKEDVDLDAAVRGSRTGCVVEPDTVVGTLAPISSVVLPRPPAKSVVVRTPPPLEVVKSRTVMVDVTRSGSVVDR